MSEFEEDWVEGEMEEEDYCDYGAEYCEHPNLRDMGCCFECPLYQEMCETEEKEKNNGSNRD